jgi:hypothetical protein
VKESLEPTCSGHMARSGENRWDFPEAELKAGLPNGGT